jgi:hypothetical protein
MTSKDRISSTSKVIALADAPDRMAIAKLSASKIQYRES